MEFFHNLRCEKMLSELSTVACLYFFGKALRQIYTNAKMPPGGADGRLGFQKSRVFRI